MYTAAYLPERLRQCKPQKTILQYFTYNSNWHCERSALFKDGTINCEIAYYQANCSHLEQL